MVEYTYDEAVALLESNLATALDKQVCVCEREKGLRAMGFVLSYYLVNTAAVPQLAVQGRSCARRLMGLCHMNGSFLWRHEVKLRGARQRVGT